MQSFQYFNSVAAYSQEGKELGIVFETATPFETPIRMEELVNWTRINREDKFPYPLNLYCGIHCRISYDAPV